MATNEPPSGQPTPNQPEDQDPSAPAAHGSSAAPPPYGRPPGDYDESAYQSQEPGRHPGQGPGSASGQDPYQGEYPGPGRYAEPGHPGQYHGEYQSTGQYRGPGQYQGPGHFQGAGQNPYPPGPPPGYYQQPGPPNTYQQGYQPPYGWAPPKSRLAAGLLGIFLGGLGIHRFYLGYTTIGVVQLLVTLFTFGAGAIWGFVEGIMILAGAQTFRTDARGMPLRE
ncbi:NINE protein [Arthrobacter sp. 7Tela_A1]|uniref:NINE protein n=1 Tax=Arthrobacter sp. 7Tela_A1 TaxID=3093745 RepID=UPI003BB67E60